jgi:hypothetical protein
MVKIMGLFAWLVGVSAITLDNVVYYTVVVMGNYVKGLTAVGVTWRILRDLANIGLIFGFIGAGIATILDVEKYGWGTKMLPMLLVAAVVLNFSLFISEAMIDATNLFATEFYTQINGGVPAGTQELNFDNIKNAQNNGIANKIMGQLGLQTIYGNAITNPQIFQGANPWFVGFMGVILFLVTAFVMFSLAFILIIRFVALIFLILLSPVGFMGLAIPQLKYRAGQWWTNFLEQIVVAPVLLLLLYVALAVITDAQFLTGFGATKNPNAWTGWAASGGLTGFAGLLLSFLVAIGLLLVVVIKAKSMSAAGANWATKTAGKLTFGVTASVGRRTVGRASNYTARKIRSSEWGQHSELGRMFAGLADRGAKASFDVRGAVGGSLKSYVDVGAAQKGGYRAREEELINARTEYAKSLRQSPEQIKMVEDATDAKKKAGEEYKKNMAPLEAEEQKQLKITKEIVDASNEELKLERKKLEEARQSSPSMNPYRDYQIKTYEAAYNEKLLAHQKLQEEESKKLDPIRTKIEDEKKHYTGVITKQQEIIDKNTKGGIQKEYAESLQEKTLLGIPRAPYDWTTAVGSARHEAAGKILGELKKDPTQIAVEKLQAAVEKAEKVTGPRSEEKKGGSKPENTEKKPT